VNDDIGDAAEFGYRLAEVAAHRAGAGELLDVLRDLGDAPAAIMTRRHDDERPGDVVAVHGYAPAIVRAITDPRFVSRDPAYREIRQDQHRPLRCWWDLDFDYGATPLGRELLVPAGFRGGVSLRLETRHGCHVGDLHMSTEDRRYPSPQAMRALQRSRHVLAQLFLDEASEVSGPSVETDVVRICSDGRIVTLGSGPDATVSVAVHEMAARHAGIVAPGGPDRVRRWIGPDGSWYRVMFRGSSRGSVVTVGRKPVPYGLTRRELEVLEMVGRGIANFGISRRLDLSERTVAHCIERILKKLNAASRAQAAAIAERDGLIVVR
jgi:DNA-binding CsgD family transcriptional regulator